MSVAASVTLPDQPANGTVVLLPLGGDGNSAPRSRYEVFAFAIAGDGSGGNAVLTLTLDDVYESLVMQVSCFHNSPNDSENVFQLVSRKNAVAINAVTAHLLAEAGPTSRALAIWCPPPLINVTEVNLTTPNLNTETYQMSVTILNFNKRASERTPLNILYASLPRGTSDTAAATT